MRDHVEELIVNRLSQRREGDLPEHLVEQDFRSLSTVFEVTMNKVLWSTRIPGFTDDDLVSFMLMHAHLVLRRQRYDFAKNPYSFFYVSFNNLMRDILRAQARKQCDDMYRDLFDLPDLFDNRHHALDPEKAEGIAAGGVV